MIDYSNVIAILSEVEHMLTHEVGEPRSFNSVHILSNDLSLKLVVNYDEVDDFVKISITKELSTCE